MRYYGAHVSTSGGWDKAVARVAEMGGNAVQIFSSSPRMWRMTDPAKIDFDGFLAAREKLGVEKAVIHATYLINLASDNPELVEKSKVALKADMEICAMGKFEGIVVHVGSHQGRGWEAVKNQLVESISEIVEASPEGSRFLIENSAGQKGKIASDLSEIRFLLDNVKSEKLGWCFDTCHGHAAGHSLSTKHQASNNKPNHQLVQGKQLQNLNDKIQNGLFADKQKTAVDEIEKYDLWSSLKCIHVNDSRDPFDSGRDRHDNLGEGKIAKEDMAEFLAHPKLAHVPMILEVPGLDGNGPDKENMERLKQLVV